MKHISSALLLFCILALCQSQNLNQQYPSSPFGNCGYPGSFKVDQYFFSSNVTKIIPFSEDYQSPPEAIPKEKVCRPDGHCLYYFEIDVIDKNITAFQKTIPVQCSKSTSRSSQGTWILSFGSAKHQGATIRVPEGHQSIVRFNNKVSQVFFQNFSTCTGAGKVGRPFSIHNQGQASLSQFDGFPEAPFCRNQSFTYIYPNNVAKTGYYRDSANSLTTENNYYGAAGAYIVSAKKKHGGCGEPFNLEDVEERIMMIKDTTIDDYCQHNIFIFEDAAVPRKQSIKPELLNEPLLTNQQLHLLEASTRLTGTQIQQRGQVPHRQNFHNDFLYGDINLVNGIPFPKMNLEPKIYRFRMINAANERAYLISIRDINNQDYSNTICRIVATDGGFLNKQQEFPKNGLLIAAGERYEFICDFKSVAGKELFFINDRDLKMTVDIPMFCYSHLVSKIVVSLNLPTTVTLATLAPIQTNRANLISPLLTSSIISGLDVSFASSTLFSPAPTILKENKFQITEEEYYKYQLMASREQFHRRFDFQYRKDRWKINQFFYEEQKIGADNIAQNSWEVWYLRGGIGIMHTIHLRMVNFLVLKRSDDGANIIRSYQAISPKDTVFIGPNNHVFILVKMGPHTGDFMYECMNLIHQDMFSKQIMRIVKPIIAVTPTVSSALTYVKEPLPNAGPLTPTDQLFYFGQQAILRKINTLLTDPTVFYVPKPPSTSQDPKVLNIAKDMNVFNIPINTSTLNSILNLNLYKVFYQTSTGFCKIV